MENSLSPTLTDESKEADNFESKNAQILSSFIKNAFGDDLAL